MNPVVHFEVPSADRDRARSFYAEVFGWEIEETPLDDDVYTSVITTPVTKDYEHEAAGAINGAIIDREDLSEGPIITIQVDSIDAATADIDAAGGHMVGPSGEVPDAGSYAYFEDSEGNVIGLWEPLEDA